MSHTELEIETIQKFYISAKEGDIDQAKILFALKPEDLLRAGINANDAASLLRQNRIAEAKQIVGLLREKKDVSELMLGLEEYLSLATTKDWPYPNWKKELLPVEELGLTQDELFIYCLYREDRNHHWQEADLKNWPALCLMNHERVNKVLDESCAESSLEKYKRLYVTPFVTRQILISRERILKDQLEIIELWRIYFSGKLIPNSINLQETAKPLDKK